ncbi:hypothetical protein H8A95_09115 [Bradyrhizobium sp. Pear76]|uniref:hypothetical protein n=1 Tax=Bradyrhizobium oropedii TaxID=1571201 RepID=UPI001E326617|nr:hypothetical protein [Bradyrhizobium oropedii]MCC8962468.1 hypothetical protein [Bradyrhizobium oropedii]
MTFMPKHASFEAAPESRDTAPPVVKPSNGGEVWTEDHILTLARLVREEGLSNGEVAHRMGRTETSIVTAVSRYSVRDPKARLRACMTCKRPFFSLHIGHRICGKCRVRHQFECT